MAENNKSLFELMNPKQAFLFGIIGGILVLCTIGFFILLLGGIKTGGTSRTLSNTNIPSVPSQPNQPSVAAPIPAVTTDDLIRGNTNASIFIVEYSDLECPYCARFHDTMKQVVNVYGDDVAWVYRHFPLESIHPNARLAANAVECSAELGNDAWAFTDLLFERQAQGLTEANIIAAASSLGINTTRLQSCMNEGKYNTLVTQQIRDAQAAGGQGTPFSVLIGPNGEQVPISGAQSFASVEAVILQFLN